MADKTSNREKNQEKNPRNPESSLFKQLTRLLSGPIINRRTQIYRQERRDSLDKYAKRFRSASGKEFKKSEYNPFETIQTAMTSNMNRGERYSEFDQMEYTPEIASALDIYADEMTTSSTLESMMVVECPNAEIKDILENLYYKVLDVEFNLFGWCRNMCKYGDFFLYLDLDEEMGIKNVIGLPGKEVERLEGEDETNPNYVQFQWNSAGMTFENWQIAHFRILGNDKYAPYGTSVLEAARRIWRQLTLLEDAMMAYRIVRSPERRVFYIDVGNIDPQDVEQYMQKVMTSMKRNQVIDPDTGRVDLRYNPLSIEEDYFMPVRGSTSNSKIDNLSGGQFTGDIDDVKYLRDKLFSALKIPQSYLSRGDGADEDKTTLAQKDIRFARTIQRLQRAVISELEKIGLIHLYTLGYKGDDLISHKLYLNNPSRIAELQEVEYWKTKFDVAGSATENFFSKQWIAKNLFGLSEDDFIKNQRELFYDKKFNSQLEQAGQDQMEQESAGGGDIGGDMFGGGEAETSEGDSDLADVMSDTDTGTETETPDEANQDPLMIPPAKREDNYKYMKSDGSTTTTKSNGNWYKPVKIDDRKSGARTRSWLATSGREKSFNNRTNVFSGANELFTLSNGVYESKSEEKHILKTNVGLKRLLESLEKLDEKQEEVKDETET